MKLECEEVRRKFEIKVKKYLCNECTAQVMVLADEKWKRKK